MLIDAADIGTVDFQIGQSQLGEVADLAEAPTKVLQADAITGVEQADVQTMQLFGRR
ncbi:hypothetical protein D3C76_1637410 [compost metagenome]